MLYKENFAWVDNVRIVSNPELIKCLDQKVITDIQSSSNDVHFCLPWMPETEAVANFYYSPPSKKAQVYTDLVLTDLLKEMRSPITLDAFRRRRIYLGNDDAHVTAWRCLFADIRHDDGQTYCLHDGKWYRVNRDFVADVDEECNAIPVSDLTLPLFQGSDEGHYAKSIADCHPDQMILMDGTPNLISHGGGQGKVEVCDLLVFAPQRKLVHLKIGNRAGAISHLLSQSMVSAELLLRDKTFRAKVNDMLPPLAQFDGVYDTNDIEIVLAIVQLSTENRPQLPIFSRVNLRNAYRKLRDLGYKVSILAIGVLPGGAIPQQLLPKKRKRSPLQPKPTSNRASE